MRAADDRTAKRAGSPAFLAPELCIGPSAIVERADIAAQNGLVSAYAADCWSLGVTLHACLTARLPFLAANPLDLMDVIVNQPSVLAPMRAR